MLSPRYAKFLTSLAGAIGLFLIVLVEQNANLIPRDWQPYVMLAYSLAVSFGVRQIPNTPPKGEAARPDMSEQDSVNQATGTGMNHRMMEFTEGSRRVTAEEVAEVVKKAARRGGDAGFAFLVPLGVVSAAAGLNGTLYYLWRH